MQRKEHHAREEAWFGKNHRERSRMKTIITEMSGLSSRLDRDEDGAGKLERKAEEITQNVAKKKKD